MTADLIPGPNFILPATPGGSYSSATDVTLAGPLSPFTVFTMTAPGQKVILPPMNQGDSPALNVPFYIAASSGSYAFDLYSNDGLGRITNVLPGVEIELVLSDGSTANGTLAVFAGGSVGQLPGINTADIANTGMVGELVSSVVVSGSAVALTTGVGANVTSIVLTAGDWDVWGSVSFSYGATTTVNDIQISFGSTSATIDPTPGRISVLPMFGLVPGSFTNITSFPLPSLPLQVPVGTTTTIYLVTLVDFGVSTMSAYGAIYARRRR